MLRSTTARVALGIVLLIAVLGLLRFKPWQRGGSNSQDATSTLNQQRQELAVGFLPVTCHLTCPVTDYATKTSAMRFASSGSRIFHRSSDREGGDLKRRS